MIKIHQIQRRTHRMMIKNPLFEICGKMICHKCDNPSCCNPDHLFLGNAKTNKLDAVNKKRHAFGEKNGGAKLNEKDVIKIKSLYDNGFSSRKIGRLFNVGKSTILRIINKKTWKYL